jgi:hypothetical protein
MASKVRERVRNVSYKESDPENPVIFRRGEMADAEPAIPGWRMAVDELFA